MYNGIGEYYMLSKEQLGSILLHNYHDVLNRLKRFKELSEDEQKIVLLSACFDSNIIIPYPYLINILSENEKLIISKICVDYSINEPYIRFYYTDGIPKLSVSVYKKRVVLTIPTRGEFLFKSINEINKNELIDAICNNCLEDNKDNKYTELFKSINNIEKEDYSLKRGRYNNV